MILTIGKTSKKTAPDPIVTKFRLRVLMSSLVHSKHGDFNMQLALSIDEAQVAIGLGKTKIYQLINSGDLKARKVGKRTIFLKADVDAFLSNLESIPPKQEEV